MKKIEIKNTNELLNVAKELFKDSRELTIEEQQIINDYFRGKSKVIGLVRVKEDA